VDEGNIERILELEESRSSSTREKGGNVVLLLFVAKKKKKRGEGKRRRQGKRAHFFFCFLEGKGKGSALLWEGGKKGGEGAILLFSLLWRGRKKRGKKDFCHLHTGEKRKGKRGVRGSREKGPLFPVSSRRPKRKKSLLCPSPREKKGREEGGGGT